MTTAARRAGVRSGVLLLLGCCLALVGCASYTGISQKTLPYLERRDYARGLAELRKLDSGPDRVLILLDRGLFYHYAGAFDSSNVVFQEAEDLIDELYTRSVTTEALSLVTSDQIRPYDGPEFERVMVHFYRALNYIGLGLRDDALVEARKANAFLARHAADLDDVSYGYDAFMEYFTGLLYEWGGEWNDAYVSYRNAEAAYESSTDAGGPGTPVSLADDLVRCASRLGLRDDVESWRARFPGVDPAPPASGTGDVLLVIENGFAPRLVERRVDIPILKTDDEDRDAVWTVATNAYHRWHHHGYQKVELAYLLSIAYPVIEDASAPLGAIRSIAAGDTAGAALASDVAFNLRRNFQDRESAIVIRTIVRALLKYLAKKGAEKEVGWAAGLAVDVLGSLTERADVRSWRSLPRGIWLVRQRLPAGTHDLVLQVVAPDGGTRETVTLTDVHVAENRTTWVSYRLFN